MKVKQTEKKEIGRVKLTDTQNLVASLVDNEKLDLKIFIKSDSYTGAKGKALGSISLMIIGLSLRSSLAK